MTILDFLLPHLPALFAAAFGGFAGAYVAFLLERGRRKQEEKKAKVSAILRAQLTLIGYIEALENLNRQYLDSLRNDSQRHYKLTFGFVSPIHGELEVNSLSFLAEHKKPQVFHEINLAQRAYYSAIDALHVRNRWLERFFSSEVTVLARRADGTLLTSWTKTFSTARVKGHVFNLDICTFKQLVTALA